MFTMKSEVVGRSSVVSDDLVQSVDQKICERRRFTISELSYEFPQILSAVLYEIITVRPGYRKICARWVPKIITRAHKTYRMTSAFVKLFRPVPQKWR
jgi:oligoribonuclease (3'-5' exoribonuclease)